VFGLTQPGITGVISAGHSAGFPRGAGELGRDLRSGPGVHHTHLDHREFQRQKLPGRCPKALRIHLGRRDVVEMNAACFRSSPHAAERSGVALVALKFAVVQVSVVDARPTRRSRPSSPAPRRKTRRMPPR